MDLKKVNLEEWAQAIADKEYIYSAYPCECGTAKVLGNEPFSYEMHSDWCPRYRAPKAIQERFRAIEKSKREKQEEW